MTDALAGACPSVEEQENEMNFVNGAIVWRDGKPTGLRPERVLPR